MKRWPLIVCALGLGACGGAPKPAPAVFSDYAGTAVAGFRHQTGARGEFLLTEITGSGVGLIDYDNDGDLDVIFAQGAPPGASAADHDCLYCNRLLRNELVESGALAFSDVSTTAGELGTGHAVGIAAGDIDNDGDTDLFISGVENDYLLRNDNGRFVDITDRAGVADPRWNASASFADYDGDADLDLFVTAYVADPVANNRACRNRADQRDYCAPSNFEPLADRLYANDGQGRFRDVSADSGIAAARGAGLGVVAGDFNRDGATDFYVANDQTANHLWINNGDGTFTDNALVAGAAYNADGRAEASMGLALADFDDDGDDDLFMTHLNNESNTLYRNDGQGFFSDVTDRARLGASSLAYTGWGGSWFDADHDADLDVFVANGAVSLDTAQGDDDPYGQADQLWLNEDGRYALAPDALPSTPMLSSRGAAFGDLDNDGDIDIVVNSAGAPARVYLNGTADAGNWLLVRLRDVNGNREGIGARVVALREGAPWQWRRVARDGSFASANDVRVHFGLAGETAVELGVIWPDGSSERFSGQPVNREITLRRGAGVAWRLPTVPR